MLHASLAPPPPPPPAARETVLLLHGLGRTCLSLFPLARALEREGYHVVNLSYPWRTRSLEELAAQWLPARLAEAVPPASPRVHVVTHSMGGILVRLWLRERSPAFPLGRVVMLAPPNAGSPLADRLAAFPPFRWLVGPSGPRLGTGPDSLPHALGPWPAGAPELGIVAGDRRLLRQLDAVLPPPHDGKVSVAATHLAGERAHLTLPFSHPLLPWRSATHRAVAAFLRDGRFPAAP